MIALFPDLLKLSAAGDVSQLAAKIRELYFSEIRFKEVPLNIDHLISELGLSLSLVPLNYPGAVLVSDFNGRFSVNLAIKDSLRGSFSEKFLKAKMVGEYFFNCQNEILNGSKMRSWGIKIQNDPFLEYLDESIGNNQLSISSKFAAEIIFPISELNFQVPYEISDLRTFQRNFALPSEFLLAVVKRAGNLKKDGLERNALLQGVNNVSPPSKPILKNDQELYSSSKEPIAIPRSFAASTYRATQKNTQHDQLGQNSDKIRDQQSNKGDKSKSGMERIRELARKIDSSV